MAVFISHPISTKDPHIAWASRDNMECDMKIDISNRGRSSRSIYFHGLINRD
jgi:hypothetical protein